MSRSAACWCGCPPPSPSGTALNIAAPLADWTEELELSGNAKWSRPVGDGGGYWVGLELEDSSPEDMRKWYSVVQRLQA